MQNSGPVRPPTGSMPSGTPVMSMPASNRENILLAAAGQSTPTVPAAPLQQQAPAGPSHDQTAALIYHVAVVQKHLHRLLANPKLGHEDCSGEIARVQADLLTSGMLNPQQVAEVMGTVPSSPAAQRHWTEVHLVRGLMAQNKVLDHHRAAFKGTGDFAAEIARHPSSSVQHSELITRAANHYRTRG